MTQEELRKHLRRIRNDVKLPQARLSVVLGHGATWVKRIENGEIGIKLEDVSRWADACQHRMLLRFVPSSLPAVRDNGLTEAEQATIDELVGAMETMSPRVRELLWGEISQSLTAWKEVDKTSGKDVAMVNRFLRLFGRQTIAIGEDE